MKVKKTSLQEEIKAALTGIGVATKGDLKPFATKDDLQAMEERQDKKYATKDDLIAMEVRQDKKYATKDDLKNLVTKDDAKKFATKEGLKPLATKNDLLKVERRLKRRMGADRNKIVVTIGKLATSTRTLKAFDELKGKVENITSTN